MAKIQGTGTALITPFKKTGVVDEAALRKLVDWQIKNKIEFLVPCGSTGEAITMTRGERRRVIEIVVEQVNGRVPVIPGTGSSSTMDTIHLSKDAILAGADAVLIVGPAYNKPTQEGYYMHFSTVIEQTGVKVVMYNIPGRTAGNILPETVLNLAEQYRKNVIGIKEASNNFEQIMQIIRHKPESFSVLSGEDTLTLPLIACGAEGVIAVIPNEMPKEFGDMVRMALKGEFNKAKALHYKMFPLMRANFLVSNPIPVKTALVLMGKADENFRLPLTKMTKPNKDKLKKIMKELKLIK